MKSASTVPVLDLRLHGVLHTRCSAPARLRRRKSIAAKSWYPIAAKSWLKHKTLAQV